MRNARLSTSPRLRRALRALQQAKGELSSWELMDKARVCAPGTVVSELRANGAVIDCRQDVINGERRWFYTLKKSPKQEG